MDCYFSGLFLNLALIRQLNLGPMLARYSANQRARNSKRKKVISLEGWVDIMYYVMDAHSFFSFIYFILLIVIGSFFMINLCLVVIATQFSETKQREQRLMEEARLKFMSNDSTLASYQDCFQNPRFATYAIARNLALNLALKIFENLTATWFNVH